jgi:response regulator RpfG family c-di-GMP phosphodiesterase
MKKLEKIYIVEDSDIERSMLKDHLTKYNLELKEYSSGTTCIKEIVLGTVDEPDLVVMDYFLESTFGPSKDGLESLDKLKEVSPNTSVIMYTSVDNPRIKDLAKQKGALDYVVKGVTAFKELDSILEKHFSLKN